MADKPAFQDIQNAFAAHIRDPANVPAPEHIEDRRMAVYRDLFFNNLKSLLSTTFPVLKALHDDRKWRHMIREFMKKHSSQTPYFLQLPAEFLEFLQTEYEISDDDFPFLLELAHYEYIELALSISDAEIDYSGVDPDGDLIAGVPVKSELSWVYAYQYPVHRISKDFIPDAPAEQPVYLAVTRNAEDRVRFTELNPVTAGLVDAIEQNSDDLTGEDLLRRLAQQIQYPDADAFIEHGQAAFSELKAAEIVIGTKLPE